MKSFALYSRLLILLPAIILTFHSCSKEEEEETEGKAELTVVVKDGSGILQQNIVVGLYPTEEDADNMTNLLKSTVNTNASGESKFLSLDGGTAYWVRAQGPNSGSVDQTDKLNVGNNTFEMTIY